jgi:Domain of unknown function (DUF6265)
MNRKPVTILRPSVGFLQARFATASLSLVLALSPFFWSAHASAQTPAPIGTPAGPAAPAAPTAPASPASPTPPVNPSSPLDQFAWLHGCWDGKVNQRDFREEWLPLRGDMMVGVSQTVSQGKTLDFEYLRLESRPEGAFYVAVPSGTKETSFRFAGKTVDDGREIFAFENATDEFPQRIIYRRGTEGWLYATVEGKVNGQPKSVMYPMRRVDCVSGAFIRQ